MSKFYEILTVKISDLFISVSYNKCFIIKKEKQLRPTPGGIPTVLMLAALG